MNKTFIPYQQALQVLEENRTTFPNELVSIHKANGRILAEDLKADRDFPPYHRVTMDGIAIKFHPFENGQRDFKIQEVAQAGSAQKTLQNDKDCIEVMTGAMLPNNTDTIIRYEDLKIEDGVARITEDSIKKRQNIHFKGIDVTQGAVIKTAGQPISSAEVNIMAATGVDQVLVKALPKMVIISTGDELVDVNEKPLPHQIRRSNVYGIKNTLHQWGIDAALKHLPDEKEVMQQIIEQLLIDYDVLIFTGGVSKGKYDFLPDILEQLEVKKHFHKIQQRPGKPIWFGTKGDNTFVFGLPGNPVSSFVCLYAYVRFWLLKSLDQPEEMMFVCLAEDVTFIPDLIFFTEAKLESKPDAKLWAYPKMGNGSGDFINLIHTDGFLVLPQDKQHFKKGEVYPFLPYRHKF